MRSLSPRLSLVALAFAFAVPCTAAEPTESNADSGTKKPRVLIIGDSISIGYTAPVQKLLQDVAEVKRIPANGGPTTYGLKQIDSWLGDQHWDVIHFNWGLHDLKYMTPNGKLASPDKGGPQVSLADYEQNLNKLVARMKQTGAKLIFATTTPVPEGAPFRLPEDAGKYNDVAEKVMQEQGVAINDLNVFATAHVPTLPRDVHYDAAGYQKLGEHVAEQIQAALPLRKTADEAAKN